MTCSARAYLLGISPILRGLCAAAQAAQALRQAGVPWRRLPAEGARGGGEQRDAPPRQPEHVGSDRPGAPALAHPSRSTPPACPAGRAARLLTAPVLLVDLLAGDQPGRLVLGELRDAAGVTLLAGERLGDEQVDEADRLVVGVLARADRYDVRVVVLAGQERGGLVPHERGTDARDLVRGDLLAVARTAEDDTECRDSRALVLHDGVRGVDAERGIVVERLVLGRAVVHHLVPRLGEVRRERLAELEAGVVRSEVDAHGFDPIPA